MTRQIDGSGAESYADDTVKSFAGALKQARKRAQLTQWALAGRAGLSLSEICHVENGRRAPRLDTITKLAKGLGVPVAELMKEGK